MFVYNKDAVSKEISPGIHRKILAHDEGLMVCEFFLEKGAVLPDHSHPHKQCTYVVSGKLRFTVGDETRKVGTGDNILIPSGVSHKVEVLEDAKVTDAFTPAREDFL